MWLKGEFSPVKCAAAVKIQEKSDNEARPLLRLMSVPACEVLTSLGGNVLLRRAPPPPGASCLPGTAPAHICNANLKFCLINDLPSPAGERRRLYRVSEVSWKLPEVCGARRRRRSSSLGSVTSSSDLRFLVQRPQPEDGIPGRLHHAAGGH